jgi:hypothetical protein
MLIRDTANFIKGVLLAVTFLIVLVIIFMPLFGGENGLRAADRLFNSISKDSSHYIPSLQKKNQAFMGVNFTANLKLKNDNMAQQANKILTVAGAKATVEGAQLKDVSGDLGKVLAAALADSDAMFYNKDSEVSAKYGFPGKDAMFVWWNICKDLDKDFKKQTKFKEAAFVSDVTKKGVEVAYNYFKIEPVSAASNAAVLTGSLIFYVIYTLWWGIAVLLIFEGLGLEMKAGARKEV